MKKSAGLAMLLLASCTAGGSPDVTVRDAWMRPAVAGKAASAAYLTIENRGGGDDRLVTVSTPIGEASIHSTTMDGGVMRMRPVEAIDVIAASSVELKPGGLHIMVTGLRQPVAEGGTVSLHLRFERSGERRVEAAVRPAAPATDKT